MNHKSEVETRGYTIIEDVFSTKEIHEITSVVEKAIQRNLDFNQDKSLFAIRNLLDEAPLLQNFLWNKKLTQIMHKTFGPNYFVVRAIYFDKPPLSNWMVPWHQDLTIVVDAKKEITGFKNWSIKNDNNTVQPPFEYMNDIYTIRIHIDDCDETNGAMKVIPCSHTSILPTAALNEAMIAAATVCKVASGGIMIMKPLLWHASGKSKTDKNRRVIHLEFASKTLPDTLKWNENELQQSFGTDSKIH